MTRIGIIDLGSNSARLVIYEVRDSDSYRPCYRLKENIRLAQYIDESGRISDAGFIQAIASIRTFCNVGKLYKVDQWIAAGTAAVRQSTNGLQLLERLHQETGVRFRELSGQEEAWYSYLGVINTIDVEDAILMDIGGASTEIIEVRDRKLEHSVSLPFGALTLTRKFSHLESHLQTDSILLFMQREMSKIPWLKESRNLPLIGTGGTARALGKIAIQMQRSQENRLDGVEVQPTVLQQIYETVKDTNISERKKLGKLSESRSEIIHAGVATAWSLMTMISSTRFIVSGNGLREGLFYEYFLRDGQSPIIRSVKDHSIHNLIKLFDAPMDVIHRVSDCADTLLELLAHSDILDMKHKELLQMSVWLDMIGMFVNVERYTKHTDYLIRSSHLHGFSRQEILRVSQVILGSGDKLFKQLNLVIQLAKTFVFNTGINDICLQKDDKELIFTCSREHLSWTDADFESMRKAFEKQFGIKMRRRVG